MREDTRRKRSRSRRPRVVAFEIPWRSFRPRTRFEKNGPEAGVFGPALPAFRAIARDAEGRRVRP